MTMGERVILARYAGSGKILASYSVQKAKTWEYYHYLILTWTADTSLEGLKTLSLWRRRRHLVQSGPRHLPKKTATGRA